MSESGFRDACLELAESCRNGGMAPDCIVGIRTGGWAVAQGMAPLFPDAVLLDVCLRRPSTGSKTGAVKRVVKGMPRFFQNWLRILEAYLLAALDDGKVPSDVFTLPEGVAARLAKENPGDILIVDDAIDSGKTIWRVAEAVKRAVPSARVKTAVITVTTKKPLVSPDFSLYNNRTLIRFPWAIDA